MLNVPGLRANRELLDLTTSALREAEASALAMIGRKGGDRARARRRAGRIHAERRWRTITSRVACFDSVTPDELAHSQVIPGYTKNHTNAGV